MLLVVALGAAAPGALSAQAAVLAGTVRDAASGAAVQGATLVLRGTPLSTVADHLGRFRFPGLPPGRYVLIASAIGYELDSLPPVTLMRDEQRDVTLVLASAALVLDEMVVTAGRAAERTEEAIASVAMLSIGEAIDRNVATLDEALAYVPGVTFNGEELLDIRGAAGYARGIGSRVLLMLDGHPILTGDGAELDFRSIPLLDVDRAEVVKGAYSAAYGSSALGGVVNVVTAPVGHTPETVVRVHADAYDFQPGLEWSDELQSAFGVGLQHSRRVGPLGARAFLGYEASDGFSENGEYRRWLGRVKAGSPSGSGCPWDAYALYSRERAGEAFLWRSVDEPYRVPASEAGNYTEGYKLLTGASVVPYASPSLLLRLAPYVNANRTGNYFADNDDWHWALKPGLAGEVAWYGSDRHAVRVGVDGAHTWVRSNYIGSPRIVDLAAFAQDEVRLGSALKGTLGLRLDYHTTDLTAGEWRVSPKVGTAVQVGRRATLRASVGAGYRAPTAIEQFVSSRQFGFEVVPNLELTGERAWSGEIGMSVTLGRSVRLDGGAFGSLYSDLISPGAAPGQPFVFQFQNLARARVAGLDVGVNAELVPRVLGLEATYLLLDTEDRDTGEPLPYRSRHNVTGTVTLLGGLAGVDVRYRSRIDAVLAFPLDERTDVTVVDLRLGYRLLNVLWQARVANVFNRFYVDAQERNPGAPRSFTLTAVHGL